MKKTKIDSVIVIYSDYFKEIMSISVHYKNHSIPLLSVPKKFDRFQEIHETVFKILDANNYKLDILYKAFECDWYNILFINTNDEYPQPERYGYVSNDKVI